MKRKVPLDGFAYRNLEMVEKAGILTSGGAALLS